MSPNEDEDFVAVGFLAGNPTWLPRNLHSFDKAVGRETVVLEHVIFLEYPTKEVLTDKNLALWTSNIGFSLAELELKVGKDTLNVENMHAAFDGCEFRTVYLFLTDSAVWLTSSDKLGLLTFQPVADGLNWPSIFPLWFRLLNRIVEPNLFTFTPEDLASRIFSQDRLFRKIACM
jgi:hypothetical protein